jgi:hypothetical protein
MPKEPALRSGVRSDGAVHPDSVVQRLRCEPSGATVFKMTWRANNGQDSPRVYLTVECRSAVTDDLDTGGDVAPQGDHVLFSQVIRRRARSSNYSTAIPARSTPIATPTAVDIEGRLGLGGGDVDALCAIDRRGMQ